MDRGLTLPIRAVTIDAVDVPIAPAEHVATPIGVHAEHHVIVVSVDAHDVTGAYYVRALTSTEARAISEMISHLSDVLLGKDAAELEKNWRAMLSALRFTGQTGLGLFAVAALDACLWDMVGKALGLPLWRLIDENSVAEAVPCYASGLFLSSSVRDLLAEAERYVDEGFDAVKMRVGSRTAAEDMDRVAAVRSVIGPERQLMLDAVLAWDESTALERTGLLNRFDPFWIEDPVEYEGGTTELERVTKASGVRIAAGEFISGVAAFRAAIDCGAADVLLLDFPHLGGITGSLAAASYAESRGQPVAGHVFREVMIHFHIAKKWPLPLEYVDWWDGLFARGLAPSRGRISVPAAPGLGITFDMEYVTAHSVERRRLC